MSAGAARLKHAMKTLQEHWEQTREQWDDRVARDFEKNHLYPLDHQVEHTVRGMGKLTEILARVRQDCS
ncbi:MAG: hypothetical protein U0794_08290 [Isosphaeraceae bacterium]